MLDQAPALLQYGALGLLALFMVGFYLLLLRLTDRMASSYDKLVEQMLALNNMSAVNKADVVKAVNDAERNIINEIRHRPRPLSAAKGA